MGFGDWLREQVGAENIEAVKNAYSGSSLANSVDAVSEFGNDVGTAGRIIAGGLSDEYTSRNRKSDAKIARAEANAARANKLRTTNASPEFKKMLGSQPETIDGAAAYAALKAENAPMQDMSAEFIPAGRLLGAAGKGVSEVAAKVVPKTVGLNKRPLVKMNDVAESDVIRAANSIDFDRRAAKLGSQYDKDIQAQLMRQDEIKKSIDAMDMEILRQNSANGINRLGKRPMLDVEAAAARVARPTGPRQLSPLEQNIMNDMKNR